VNTGVNNVHGPCWSLQVLTRAVFMGVQNDARVHGPWTGLVNTGVNNVHGPCWSLQVLTRAVFMGVQNDARVHGPWARPVNAREHGP